MKKISLLLFAFFCAINLHAQVLVSDTILLQLSKQQVDSLYTINGVPTFLFPTQYEVNVHKVIYNTLDARNNTTIASGLVIVPVNNNCAAPLISYQHGTVARKDDVFSNLRGEWIVGVAGAATGYVACMPDYIGLGVSPGLHPYQHAQTEANAVLDLLRAGKEIAARENISLSGELFLLGYSQGGHATMAAHKEIEEKFSSEFTVTAAAPMSGAYDMSGTQFDMVASFDPYSQPGYLPYLILAYQEAYGNLFNDVSEIFESPYDTLLPPFFNGNYSLGDVNAVMPSVPRLIIKQSYADAFFSDSLHPARVALRDNDLYDWLPVAPIRMGYCESDEEVSYINAIVAKNAMITRGATNVEAYSRSNTLGHFECAQPSILLSKFWFDSLATTSIFCGNTGILSKGFENTEIKVFPNPAQNETQISFSNKNKETFNIYIATSSGRIVKSIKNITSDKVLIDAGTLASDVYLVLITNGEKSYWGKLLKE